MSWKADLDANLTVNNAGAVYHTGKVMEATPEDIDKTFAVAVRGPLMLIQATFPHMSQHGRIINISSIASKLGLDNFALYAGGKAALDCITFAIAAEVSQDPGSILSCWEIGGGRVPSRVRMSWLTEWL